MRIRPRKVNRFVLAALLATALASAESVRVVAAEPPPVELRLTVVGRPTAEKQPAARNLNELFLYQNRLYIGHGDYGVNTGPTDVIAYDLATKQFRTEFTVDDEAIVLYRQIGDRLVIPGPDATEAWDLGNIYVRGPGEADKWEKRRTVPHGVHVLDVAALGDAWFAAAGIVLPLGKGLLPDSIACGAVFSSGDQGKSWKIQYATPYAANSVSRIGSIAVYKDRLYAFPYTYTTMTKDRLPPVLRDVLKEPLGQGKDASYFVFLPGAPGAGDAAAYDGRDWRAAELLPVPDVCSVQAFTHADTLIMATVSGACLPSSQHYNARRDGLPKGVVTGLWAYDGTQSRELPIKYDALKDVLTRDRKLSLLVLKEKTFFIVTTGDLQNWKWHRLPEMPAEPLSIEAAGGEFFVGLTDGTLMKSEKAQ
jgi:hypothetical protein